MYEVGCQEG